MAETIGVGPERRYCIEGRVVTMNAAFEVIERGVLYIQSDSIVAVKPEGAAAPAGFEAAPRLRTGDTLFPGLIELHNHLSYNILPLWQVPEKFEHHSEWKRHAEYKSMVSANMAVLGRTPGIVEAIVRYVECKCLLGGVTASQGVSLNSNQGIKRYYRGLVRNVEQSESQRLPSAGARIADVEAGEAEGFLETLGRRPAASYLLHLSEGINPKARGHFEALQAADGSWAITEQLCGIHALALKRADFDVLAAHGGKVVWSPLSNLLLYGQTANIEAAKQSGVLMTLGSDWSPSGSKSLFGELKAAAVESEERGGVFSARDLASMVTRNAAQALRWDAALGSLEAGKLADLVALNGVAGDPYEQLVRALETGITLVVINGVPRYGQLQFMQRLGVPLEQLRVGKAERALYLAQAEADPVVAGLSLGAARQRLEGAIGSLRELALDLGAGASFVDGSVRVPDAEYTLELDFEDVDDRQDLFAGAGEPLSERVVPFVLDPLTVAGDATFLPRIVAQANLPDYVKQGLPALYGQDVPAPFVGGAPAAVPALNRILGQTIPIEEFRAQPGLLSLDDQRRIVDEALTLLEQHYVHLSFKRSMHAVDSAQLLRLLAHRLRMRTASALPELEFHTELTSIFNALRDLHTSYVPAFPFRQKVAYLPFLVEACHEAGQRQYIVTKLAPGAPIPDGFRPGVRVRHWNGVAIERQVERIADQVGGGNPAAHHARGLHALTTRPLMRSLLPDEDWVVLGYEDAEQKREARFDWRVLTLPAALSGSDLLGSLFGIERGLDLHADQVNQVRKLFFAPPRAAAVAGGAVTAFTARRVDTNLGPLAYLRIFTFDVPDADAFVEAVLEALTALPERGLIIDVRGNGGGSIHAAERLLQLFTPHPIQPALAQFIATAGNLRLCENHRPSRIAAGLDLDPWFESLRDAVLTGASFSSSHPLTNPESCNRIGQRYSGPVVLITDALCYSATDMFAAGFVDHGIGPVLGIDANTGAGGANVWSHRQLRALQLGPLAGTQPATDDRYRALPHGTAFTIAIRRTLRGGLRPGTPLEDLGIQPTAQHALSLRDLLDDNADLIETAARLLEQERAHRLAGRLRETAEGLVIELHTENLSRIDVYVDGRPQCSQDVREASATLRVTRPAGSAPGSASEVRLLGYENDALVLARRERVEWPSAVG